jgi:hypothetical protein
MPEKIKLYRGIDAWSAVHLLGCYFLMTLGLQWHETVTLGILWEGIDYIYSCYSDKLPTWVSLIFDPRGADIMDIVMDSIGILLFIGLRYFGIYMFFA